MTCRDADSLLPLFFDGELDSKRMREVALHATKCAACEVELREFESVQSQLQSLLAAEVDKVDFSALWPAIERRLPPPRTALWSRLRAWWEEQADTPWNWAVPGAAATAVAVLALLVSFGTETAPSGGDASQVALTDYGTAIERLDTDLDSVAVFNDPDTQTIVLWIGDDSSATVEDAEILGDTELE